MTLKIAIVDDNSFLIHAIKEKLSFFDDIAVKVTAMDGSELLKKLEDYRNLDLILMDIEMPVLDGIETTQIVKQKYPQIKIIMLTAFDNDESIFKAIKAGADGYLLKEINPEELYKGIKETLNGGAAMNPSIALKTLKLLRNPIDIQNPTDHEEKLRKKTRTSGCAVGTVFGDMMAGLEGVRLAKARVRTSWLYSLAAQINRTPSLYLAAGAIHGTVLCRGDRPLVYMEDVGRHNAVDKIAGWMMATQTAPEDKILYTTGRLTSEMVIKTALMGIPVLASRSGFTAWGVELAQQVGLTLIGRMRGQRFMCLSGEDRLMRDADPGSIAQEPRNSARKGALS